MFSSARAYKDVKAFYFVFMEGRGEGGGRGAQISLISNSSLREGVNEEIMKLFLPSIFFPVGKIYICNCFMHEMFFFKS